MIAPWRHHIVNALRFKVDVEANGGIWCVIGGTTPWTDEDAPPIPDFDATAIRTPIGAKKGVLRWVKRDDAGPFAFLGPNNQVQRWVEVLEEDVITDEVRWVLLQAEFDGNELPLLSFREVGFFSGLEHGQGPAALVLTADQVGEYGNLEAVEYRRAAARQAGVTNVISSIIEF